MSTPATSEPAAKKSGRGRWFKVRVIATVLILLIGLTLYLNWRNSLPPNAVRLLSQGRAYLDVPLMTLYTFPSMGADGFHVETNVTLSAGSVFSFTWTDVAGAGLPVRFLFTGGDPFQGDASGGFTFRPTGLEAQSGFTAVRPGSAGVVLVRWTMEYTVRLMSQHDWLSDTQWIEVDYAMSTRSWFVGDLPAGNVSAPTPADLVSVGSPVRFTYGAGYSWTYDASVQDEALPLAAFTNRLPAISIPADSEGTVTAALASSFQWGPSDDYVMRMGASGAANVSLQFYLDARFGSLLAEAVA